MTASITIMDVPSPKCALCGNATHSYGMVGVLEEPSESGQDIESGLLCHRCLWAIVEADDPTERVLTEARRCESRALQYQALAERLRRVAEAGIEVPTREQTEAAGIPDGDLPF